MDESRKQFEAEVLRRAEVSGYAHMDALLNKTGDGGYATTWVDMMWEGWQASRVQLEGWVLVPKVPTIEMIEGFWGEIKHGQPEIDAATEAFNEMLKAVPSKN